MKKPNEFLNVVKIPEGSAGAFRIKHTTLPAGVKLSTVNARTSIMGGHRGPSFSWDHPTTWIEMQEDGRRWMSDLPIEQAQLDNELRTIRSGRVLVGGLGIGYAAAVLARRPRIKEVVVVEIAPEVIQLVAEHVCAGEPARAKLKFVQADLFEYLEAHDRASFDHAYYDIWAGDGESTFFSTVMPLLRLSATRVRNEPINWNETVMRGQLRMSLDSRAIIFRKLAASVPEGFEQLRNDMIKAWGSVEEMSAPNGSMWHDWSVGYFRWLRKNADVTAPTVEDMAWIYAQGYGRRGFEQRWKALTGEDAIRCELKETTHDDE